MTVYEGQTFESWYDRGTSRTFSDLTFRKCTFVSSGISITDDPSLRSTVRSARFEKCESVGCVVSAAIVEDVVVDGLKTNGMLRASAAVFKHVTLRGRVGRIMLTPRVSPFAPPEVQRAYDKVIAEYYRTVDWALDISQAEFQDADIRCIPARLIRRDPETQAVVRREVAMQGAWRELDLDKTHWPEALEGLLRRGFDDVVLVASKRARNFKALLRGLAVLREAGVADPD